MISDNMRISGFNDFYERREYILCRYKRLRSEDKLIYKYYIYSRRYICEKICDAMWEYLNASDFEETADASTRLRQGYVKYLYEVEHEYE